MAALRMSSGGQVIIPADIRRRLGLRKGTPLVIREDHGAVVIHPATREYFESLAGVISGGPSLCAEIVKEHALERDREEA